MNRALHAALAGLLLIPAAPLTAAGADGDVQVVIPLSPDSVTVTITTARTSPTPQAPTSPAGPQPAPAPAVATSAPSSSTPQVEAPRAAVPVPDPAPARELVSPTSAPSSSTPQVEARTTAVPVPDPTTSPAPSPTAADHAQPTSPTVTPAPPETPNQPPATAAGDAQSDRRAPADRAAAQWTDPAGTSSTYWLWGSRVSGPLRGIVVYLDGDGMHALSDDGLKGYALGGDSGIIAQAGARGYATLAIKSPDASATFWENNSGPRNATYIAGLVDQVRRELGVSSTWLVGYSGGSQVIAKHLLPAHADAFTDGGAILTGGGGVQGGEPPKVSAGFRMHWETGADDDGRDSSDRYNAISDAVAGATAYAALGTARVSLATPGGLAHRGMPTRLGGILASQLDTDAATPAPSPDPTEAAPRGVDTQVSTPAAAPTATPGPAPEANTATGPTVDRPVPGRAVGALSGLPFNLGVFAHDGKGEKGRVTGFEKLIGRKVDFVSMAPTRDSWATIFSGWWYTPQSQGGDLPDRFTGNIELAMPLMPDDSSLAAAAAGEYDDQWRKLGTLLNERFPNAYVRIGWEFNLPSWHHTAAGADHEQWKQAWSRAAKALKSTAPGVKTAWVANKTPTKELPDPTVVYPGDDVVDLIGLDGYDWWPAYTPESWENHHLTGEQGWQWWLDFAKSHGKKLVVPEWGITTVQDEHRGGDNPFYMDVLVKWFFKEAANIEYVAYFEDDAEYHKGSLLTQAPKSGAQFRVTLDSLAGGRAATPATTPQQPQQPQQPQRTPTPTPGPWQPVHAETIPAAVTCPTPTVTARTAGDLTAALASARPGAVISLADGTYTGRFVAKGAGTAEQPITLCGSPRAILDGGSTSTGYGLHLDGARHWRILGLTVTNAKKGVMLDGASGNLLQGLTVRNIGEEGIRLRSDSSHNTITGSLIEDIGVLGNTNGTTELAEPVYVGTHGGGWAGGQPDRSDGNHITGNLMRRFGADLDLKEGTTGTLVAGNIIDGTSTREEQAVDVKGNNAELVGNAITGPPVRVIEVEDGWGQGNTVDQPAPAPSTPASTPAPPTSTAPRDYATPEWAPAADGRGPIPVAG